MLRLFVSLLIALFMVNCGGGDDSSSGTNYMSATITHGGFDFSQNIKDESQTNNQNDGEIIWWADNNIYESGYSHSSALWFRVNENDPNYQQTYIYESTETNLDSVTSVDTSKWLNNATDAYPALKVGKIYVFKALDGYVKFKVISLDTTNESATIEYQYSSSTSF